MTESRFEIIVLKIELYMPKSKCHVRHVRMKLANTLLRFRNEKLFYKHNRNKLKLRVF